ncbi:MarR family transcriptional regulator [Pendulispora rubella]|uniref:MarR family transcriptional regulator n=1 Tax=Pendulispora rubella TaxID=2741070 RepID=A0ABZ2KXY1_9BACT
MNHLIIRLAHAHRATAATLLAEVNLYPGQELLLMRLWKTDGQSQTELANALNLDRSTVTRTVQRLEQQRLIYRKASATDGRATIVWLTAEGKRLRDKVDGLWDQLRELTLTGLTERHQTDLQRLLRRLEGNLRGSSE